MSDDILQREGLDLSYCLVSHVMLLVKAVNEHQNNGGSSNSRHEVISVHHCYCNFKPAVRNELYTEPIKSCTADKLMQ